MAQTSISKELFWKKGLKATPQRRIIAEEVLNSCEHLSSEEVYQRIQSKLPGVTRATVYNTLHMLSREGILRELVISAGRVRYDAKMDLHHHLICADTGQIIDIPNELVDELNLEKLKTLFDVHGFSITFHGRRKLYKDEERKIK